MKGVAAVSGYEYFDHVADVGIRVRATSFEELLSVAAQALVGWIGPAPDAPDDRAIGVLVEAEDSAGLLVRWLQEVLYHFQTGRFYFTGVEGLTIEGTTASARLRGRSWTDREGAAYQEVKAVTYHQLDVRQKDGCWQASVILDL